MAIVTPIYGSWTTLAFALQGLASSLTVGWQSDEVDNTTNKYDNVRVTGRAAVGTTPTVNTQIQIWALGRSNNTPTRPDAFGATSASRTILSVGNARSYMKSAAVLEVDATTTDRGYWYDFELAQLFGGIVPDFWTLWGAHNCVAALNTTGSNFFTNYQGIKYDIA